MAWHCSVPGVCRNRYWRITRDAGGPILLAYAAYGVKSQQMCHRLRNHGISGETMTLPGWIDFFSVESFDFESETYAGKRSTRAKRLKYANTEAYRRGAAVISGWGDKGFTAA